ncbi:hypothetical protein BDW74DRAFT_50572 [Aspergillus multicolor]|uniref:uncharacterized protein n=1 Tax=Aspergillus multicolor TaxID=41759 RepID=UPI003CCE2C4E
MIMGELLNVILNPLGDMRYWRLRLAMILIWWVICMGSLSRSLDIWVCQVLKQVGNVG